MRRIRYSTVPKYSKIERLVEGGGGSGAEVGREPSRYTYNIKDTNKLGMDTYWRD